MALSEGPAKTACFHWLFRGRGALLTAGPQIAGNISPVLILARSGATEVVGDLMACGGNRSATPLWLPSIWPDAPELGGGGFFHLARVVAGEVRSASWANQALMGGAGFARRQHFPAKRFFGLYLAAIHGRKRQRANNPTKSGLLRIITAKQMVGRVGFEPTTNGLKGRCSTTELPTHRLFISKGFQQKQSASSSLDLSP